MHFGTARTDSPAALRRSANTPRFLCTCACACAPAHREKTLLNRRGSLETGRPRLHHRQIRRQHLHPRSSRRLTNLISTMRTRLTKTTPPRSDRHQWAASPTCLSTALAASLWIPCHHVFSPYGASPAADFWGASWRRSCATSGPTPGPCVHPTHDLWHSTRGRSTPSGASSAPSNHVSPAAASR